MRGCIFSVLMAAAMAMRDSLSLDELSVTGGGPGEDLDEWLNDCPKSDFLGIVEGCWPAAKEYTCGDAASPESQIEESAAAEDKNRFESAAAASLVQHTGPSSRGNSSSMVEQNSSRTMYSVITLYWQGAAARMDYHDCFMGLWKAIPVKPDAEFKIVGTLFDIWKDLNQRPDLTTSSPSEYEGKPIHLCIGKPLPTAAEEFRKAFAGGFAGISGFSTLIGQTTAIFGAGEGATAIIGALDSRFEAAVDDLVLPRASNKIKMYLSRFTGSKTIAWLTLGSCGHAPITVTFTVTEQGGRYSATWTEGGAVTAKELAALIVMSR